MTNLQISEEVLAAYLRGELNAAEAAAVEAWYDASAANRKLLGEVYYILYVNDRINDTAGIDVERSPDAVSPCGASRSAPPPLPPWR